MADRDFKVKKGLQVTENAVIGGTVNGRNLATDGAKLDLIDAGATNYGDSDVGIYLTSNNYATQTYVNTQITSSAVTQEDLEEVEIFALMSL